MAGRKFFPVGDFANFSRTTRNTLHYYDKIGLLSPVRGGNKYRYYTSGQLGLVNVIRTLQKLGLSLVDIKTIKDERTPENIDDMFLSQIEKIDSKINDWVCAKKLLFTLQKTIHSTLDVDERAITIKFMPAEAIILGDLNDYSRGRNDYDALLAFYRTMAKKYPNLDMNYPVWGLFSEDQIKRGSWAWPERYYFYNPEGYDKKPAAFYAVGYTRGGYGQSADLFRRVIDYIDGNGFEICGDAFSEYPLNEICVLDDTNYLIRVMITVRRKNQETSGNV